MKKSEWCIPFAFVTVIAACLCIGCGNTDVAGTAEEPNEFAADSMSSSRQDSLEYVLSSSSAPLFPAYSSEAVEHGPGNVDGSSRESSLDFYLAQFGIDTLRFDGGLLAAKAERKSSPPVSAVEPGQTSSPGYSTEFDGSCPHQFNARSIDALEVLFPDAALEYAGLADSVRKGIMDGGCGLYMMTVKGDSRFAGFILSGVAKDAVSVIDIAVPGCKMTTESMVFRFLFRYCGEMDSCPAIVHEAVNVDMPADKCAELRLNSEWFSDK